MSEPVESEQARAEGRVDWHTLRDASISRMMAAIVAELSAANDVPNAAGLPYLLASHLLPRVEMLCQLTRKGCCVYADGTLWHHMVTPLVTP